MSSGSAVSVTTNLCRVWAKCRQDQVTSSWFSDLAVFHFTKCDHHLLFTDNFSEYFPVITVCTAWALCWHMYHIGGSISHWLSTCGCHWSRPRPAPAWAGGAHLAPGLDSCTPGTQQVATGLPVTLSQADAQVDAAVVQTEPCTGLRSQETPSSSQPITPKVIEASLFVGEVKRERDRIDCPGSQMIHTNLNQAWAGRTD